MWCRWFVFETHPNPSEALSDGPNSIPLDKVKELLTTLLEIHEVTNGSKELVLEND